MIIHLHVVNSCLHATTAQVSNHRQKRPQKLKILSGLLQKMSANPWSRSLKVVPVVWI